MEVLFGFPQCFLVPIFLAVIFALIDLAVNKRISKLFFANFILSIIFIVVIISNDISIFQESSIIEQFNQFLNNDSAISVYVIWLPLIIETVIINAILLAYKKFVDRTNR